MRLDPRLTPTDIRRILQRQAAETFGPLRASDLFDLLGSTAAAMARIAAAPLALTDEAPDQSGVEETEGGRQA